MQSFSPDLIFSVLLAACLAILAAIVLLFWPFPRQRGGDRHIDRGITFLFRNEDLIDASPAAESLLPSQDKATFEWTDARRALLPRFPGLPVLGHHAVHAAPATYPSSIPKDNASVELECLGDTVRLSLCQGQDSHCVVLHHNALVSQVELSQLSNVIENAPYPVWCQNRRGELEWSNAAYRSLARLLNKQADRGAAEAVFGANPKHADLEPETRVSVSDGDKTHWFKVSFSEMGDWTTCYALDISEVVKAEKTQRGFVQTLTKTFAQLGTGLAIFDRDQRLVLFNPALVDLTRLPAEFLSGRPSLSAFFDWLRESRVMPEPRNYTQWRDKLSELTQAAAAGTFSELWSLPNGMSFRVLGRPHPDGAIAFLFEDVTAELSLTRNFVKELEINYSLLDTLGNAIVVFSASGRALFANKAYRELWDTDPAQDLMSVTLKEAAEGWIGKCDLGKPHDVLDDLCVEAAPNPALSGQFFLAGGQGYSCSVTALAKGASAVVFVALPSGEQHAKVEGQDIFA